MQLQAPVRMLFSVTAQGNWHTRPFSCKKYGKINEKIVWCSARHYIEFTCSLRLLQTFKMELFAGRNTFLFCFSRWSTCGSVHVWELQWGKDLSWKKKIGLPCFLYHFSLQCLHLNKACLLCVHCDGKKLFATVSRGRMGERCGTVL